MSLLSDNLTAFIKVCETGTVLGASQAIGLTQTGVTQRIRSLENQLQVTLFIRTRKGMLPTKEGSEILNYCQNVLRLESELLTFNKDFKSQKNVELKFCGPTSTIRSTLTPRLIALSHKYKNLVLNIDTDDLEDRVTKLKKGIVDFAFIRAEDVPNEIEGKAIGVKKFFLIGAASWKNRPIKEIITEERSINFDPLDDLTMIYLKKFRLDKFSKNKPHIMSNIESVVEMAEAGCGYALLDEKLIDQFVARNKIQILNDKQFLEIREAFCWMPRTVYSNLFTDVINLF